MRRGLRRMMLGSVALATVATAIFIPTGVASAAVAEPIALNTAWFWKNADAQDINVGGNIITADTNNPYCPNQPGTGGAAAAEQACAEGRLPVWIRGGDFDNPEMSSAVGFDFSLFKGAKVKSFTVEFLEADCDPTDNDPGRNEPDTPQCPATTQEINAENFRLEACRVTETFGSAEARPRREIPNHTCSTRIAGTRKVRKAPKGSAQRDDHVWVFDLTAFARRWVDPAQFASGIYLRAKKPKNPENNDQLRVVLSGPRVPNAIKTKLDYTPGKGGLLPPPVAPPPDGGTGGGFTGTTGTFGTTGTTGTGTTDTGTTSDLPTTSTTPEAPASPAPQAPTAAEEATTPPLPGYAWLAILAGIVAFSLVRSVVIPTTTGIRPDGVLQQITRLNAERRGAPIAVGAAGGAFAVVGRGLTAIGSAFGDVGRNLVGIVDKVREARKG